MKRKERLPRRLKFPYQVSCGAVSATIYKARAKNGYVFFQLADLTSGRRRVRSFGSFEEARREADFQVTRIAKGEAAAADFSASDAAALARSRELLQPHGIEIESAAALLAEASKIVGSPARVLDAANWFARHNISQLPQLTVREAIEELLKVKDVGGRSDRHLSDLRHRLGRFSLALGGRQIAHVTTADIQRWLDRLKLSPQSRINFRRAITNLFNHAARRGYVVRGENPADGLERGRERRVGEIEIYAPQEFARLLAAAPPDFVPSIAIGGLAGLRSSEVERLEWKDVDLVARHIVVAAQKSKTRTRRLVPICDALAAWLQPFAGRQGLVWKGDHRSFYASQQETSAATEVYADPEKQNTTPLPPVAWKLNALRHSYGSYRLAETGDAVRVAFEMGNSPGVVHGHYKALVTATEATRWFGTRPQVSDHKP
jgi:integrase